MITETIYEHLKDIYNSKVGPLVSPAIEIDPSFTVSRVIHYVSISIAELCYMCFSGWNVQSVMYSFFMLQGRDMMDCNIIRSKSENLYECVRGKNSYQLKYSQ